MKRVALVTMLASGFLPLLAAPAHAASDNTKCSSPALGTSQTVVCVNIHTYDSGARDVDAFLDWNGTIYDITLILQQCSGTGTNCSTVQSTHNWSTLVSNNPYPLSFGHTYKARASWTDGDGVTSYVSVSSPLAA